MTPADCFAHRPGGNGGIVMQLEDGLLIVALVLIGAWLTVLATVL